MTSRPEQILDAGTEEGGHEMKKSYLLSSIVSVALFFLPSAWAQEPGITADSITVGSILDMTGPATYPMTQMHYGQLAYFQKVNEKGIYKRKIKVIAEDGGYDPGKTLAAGKLLLDRDNVFCFINTAGTAATLALNELLEARKVPLATQPNQSKRLGAPFKKYIFVHHTNYYDQARIAVDHILDQKKDARIAIIGQDDDFGQEGFEGFMDQCRKHGIEPAGVVTFQRGAKDFSGPVLKLKSLNPDYVINHALAPHGAAILKEAHKLGWKPKWVAMSGLTDAEFFKLAGPETLDFAGEIYAVLFFFPGDGDTPVAAEHRADVKNYQPKADVGNRTMWGYGMAKVLVEGLRRAEAANDLTREGLIKAMETFKEFETGVFPPLTYTSQSHAGPGKSLIAKRQGDSWVPLSMNWVRAK